MYAVARWRLRNPCRTTALQDGFETIWVVEPLQLMSAIDFPDKRFVTRADIVSRVSEILSNVYFDVLRSDKGVRSKISATTLLAPMLARLDLKVEDFGKSFLKVLVAHREQVCTSRPRCGACPLVSFCVVGQSRVNASRAPVVVDLFGGAGGMGYGFRQAGFRIGLAVEKDRNAAQTYRLNNPGVHVLEADIGKLEASDVRKLTGGRPSVICAGPPCQSYSLAGKRIARDPRHNLFRHVLDLAAALRPNAVLIENVPGIRRKVGRRNYKDVIFGELQKQFAVEVHLLRAIDYGVPQIRQRYFFFGRRKKRPAFGPPPKTHRESSMEGRLPEAPTVMEALSRLPRRHQGHVKDWARLSDGRLIWNLGTMAHAERVVKKIMKIRGREGPLSYRRVSKKYATTIIAGHRALPVHPTLHRTLSVREAASIQGFPTDYAFLGSRSTQPLQVANAVPPPLAAAIARQIKKHLRRHEAVPVSRTLG